MEGRLFCVRQPGVNEDGEVIDVDNAILRLCNVTVRLPARIAGFTGGGEYGKIAQVHLSVVIRTTRYW